ncbi:MAG: NAD(P)/FAD-dependent oxidoreductase [Coriobacteriales bacterium]|jgi:2,4-dienoyl-CoA reductase-like NADH-dependent reductase (Old Yellow Enzyme family)/thioredoxin reductase|nr:NAD(P)/FAD-dependent oxidoreductase [Coriobacteriales bacterium]
MYDMLFSPIRIGSITSPNRLVMTAMGNHMAAPDGEASDIDIAFYAERAKGGVGLVITECLTIDHEHGKGNFGQMSADNDRFIPGLTRLADAVHAHGSLIVGQIYHPGRQGIAEMNGLESMPSASATECQAVHQPTHEMSTSEIDEMVARFAAAARRLKDAGFDAVELHGAHGYLINQFLSPYTNKRTDEYGGTLENRMRFLAEIIAAIKVSCGADYPILVRLSVDEHLDYVGLPQEGIHLPEGVQMSVRCEELGIAALDISSGIYETMNTAWEPVGFDEGWKIDGPAAVKAAVTIPVIAVAVIRNPSYAESVLVEGKADMIGSARQFFADAYWGAKARQGRDDEIRRCISCLHCMEMLFEADMTGATVGCAINYQAGREEAFGEEALQARADGAGRTVVVIGAGPSGLEAAIVAARRGFRTVLFERNEKPGGQVLLASVPPKKEKMLWLIEQQAALLDKYGVETRYDSTPTLEDLKALDPWAVIIAQGSRPILPRSIEGLDGKNVYTPPQILTGEVVLENRNVGVIGSGMTGIETAEYLASQGNRITLFEMVDEIGPGLFMQNLQDIMTRLAPHNPGLYPRHKLVRLEGNTAVFEKTDTGEIVEYHFDDFVVSLGVASNNALVEEISATWERTYVVGDALKSGRLEPAISSGYKTAFEL